MSNYRNNKNKRIYEVLDWGVIDATNGREDDENMVLYKDEEGRLFVRATSEFEEKFTFDRLEDDNDTITKMGR